MSIFFNFSIDRFDSQVMSSQGDEEVMRLLREVADTLAGSNSGAGLLHDREGNRVGRWGYGEVSDGLAPGPQ